MTGSGTSLDQGGEGSEADESRGRERLKGKKRRVRCRSAVAFSRGGKDGRGGRVLVLVLPSAAPGSAEPSRGTPSDSRSELRLREVKSLKSAVRTRGAR